MNMPPVPSDLPTPLDDAHLTDLPGEVQIPPYRRAELTHGVVHIGVGGFHRAHQAAYLDELAAFGVKDWGLVGVGLNRPEMGEVLDAQDGLYLMITRAAEGDRARVIGVMNRYLFAPEDPAAVLDLLTDPMTRVVTMTITGTGYRIDAHTGEFEADHEDIAADLEDHGNPTTVFGFLVEALQRRREGGTSPFTVLSCDNMPDNGAAARTAIVSFARLRDHALADWIDEHVAFPTSMVDRITPNTTSEERDKIVADFGVADRWPVITEPFSQWIIEDNFSNGRPPLECVGVQFVADVAPYKEMKTRLLNAGHTALGYLGYLAGYRTTDEVMADPVFRMFLERMMADEIIPHLPEVPGIDLAEYQRTLLERFSNPRMGDDLARLCRRGSTKVPNYLLPSVQAAMDHGTQRRLLVLAVAGWLRFLRGYDYAGQPVPVEGPRMHLVEIAETAGTDPRPLLAEQDVFDRLGRDEEFISAVESALHVLEDQGPRGAIERFLAVEPDAA